MENRIYIVTDRQADMQEVSQMVESLGYVAEKFSSTESCIASLVQPSSVSPDMILADADISGLDGFELLRMCQMSDLHIPVLVFTGNDTLDAASKAIQFGAWDYVAKPITRQRLSVSLDNLQERKLLKSEVKRLSHRLKGQVSFKELIGESHAMRQLFEVMRRACENDMSILLLGEKGVGKKMVASALHSHSGRRQGPIAFVNCSTLHADMAEIELFGAGNDGSLEGRTQGQFEKASGGTLFLDEISHLPLEVQAQALRALQEGVVYPVGSNVPVPVNVRLVAATSENLRQCVAEGRFREDLFYRINVLPIDIPPLRERRRDIPHLAKHFMEVTCLQSGIRVKTLTPAAEKVLLDFDWPGNVLQLESVMRRVAVLSTGNTVDKRDLDFLHLEIGQISGFSDGAEGLSNTPTPLVSLLELERMHIRRVIDHCHGNMSQAARILGVSRSTLYRQVDHMQKDAAS